LVIWRGSAAILLLSAGGLLGGCALPFAGSLAFTDILTGVSLVSTATTGKGTTEVALDIVTGKDCRLLEGALREDRDFCEEPGSPATEDDFKGVVAWLEEDEPASPLPADDGAPEIMVAEAEPAETMPASARPAPADIYASPRAADKPLPVALASLTELPAAWIQLAAANYGETDLGLGDISPAGGESNFVRAKIDGADANFATWALEKTPPSTTGAAKDALTLPAAQMPALRYDGWNKMWPAADAAISPAPRDAEPGPRAAPLPPPAKPVKPLLEALLPHPEKPILRAAADSEKIRASAEIPLPAPRKPRPLLADGPVLAQLPASGLETRLK
jgi:hypothetical protein